MLIFPHHKNEVAQSCAACQESNTMQDCEDALSTFREANPKESTEQKGKPARVTPAVQECITKLCSESHNKLSDDLSTSHFLTGALIKPLTNSHQTVWLG